MASGELERLFDRYRREGDVGALEQVFDRSARELMGVALHLMRDATQAEDLVQETFITAIERAASFDAARPLMPWLVGILTVCARRERRRAGRVVEPSRLADRQPERPERAVLSTELMGALTHAFERIPGTYREVLDLHLNRDMRPAEIAVELERAPGTVRVQLHRGLEMLRRALPEGIGLGVSWELMGARGTGAVKDAVLAFGRHEAPRLVAQSVSAATAPAASSYALAKVLGALALAALGYFGFTALLDRAPTEPALHGTAIADTSRQPLAADGAASSRETLDAGREPAASIAREPARSIDPAAATVAGGREPGVWLTVTLQGVARPAESEIEITLRPTDPRIPRRAFSVGPTLALQADVTSWYRPGGADPREFIVQIDHPDWVLASQSVFVRRERVEGVDLGAERVDLTVSIEVQAAHAVVSGRVAAPPHDPAAMRDDAIYVGLFQLEGDTPRIAPEEAQALEADGTFRLRTAHHGPHLLVAVHESARPFVERLVLDAAGEIAHAPIRLDLGERIAGRVLYQDGTPAAQADITVAPVGDAKATHSMHGQPLVWIDGRFDRGPRELVADAQGAFSIEALARGEYALQARIGRNTADNEKTWVFGAATDAAPTVVRAPDGAVELRLPRVDVHLHVTSNGADVPHAEVRNVASAEYRIGGGSTWMSTTTDTTGRLTLTATTTDAHFDLAIGAPGYETNKVHLELARLAPGGALEVELVRGAAPCQLVFTSPGVDLAGFWVELTPSDEVSAAERAALQNPRQATVHAETRNLYLDAQGRANELVSVGSYLARVRPRGGADHPADPYALPIVAVLEISVPEGGELRVPFEIERGGRLRLPSPNYAGAAEDLVIVLRTEGGAAVDVEYTMFLARRDARAGNIRFLNRTKKGWTALSEVLRPGTYALEISDGLGAVTTEAVTIETGRETVLEIKL